MRFTVATAIILILVLSLSGCAGEESTRDEGGRAEEPLSGIVAEVNGRPLYWGIYAQLVDYLTANAGGDVEKVIRIKTDAFNMLVDDELLYQEAVRRGLTVPDEVVEREFRTAVSQGGGEERYRKEMAERGIGFDEARRTIRKRLTIDRFVQKHVTAGLEVTDEEVARYYEQNQEEFSSGPQVSVQQILVRCSRDADSEAEKRALDKVARVSQLLAGGRAFADVARLHSEGRYRDQGGVIGFVTRGVAPPEVDEALFELSAGEVSEPIRSDAGFHIVKVNERRDATVLPLDEASDDIRARLLHTKNSNAIKVVTGRLRESATIVSNLQ